ncbi:MAG: arsenate reductase (azurin) small subunit [Thermomicrobiales bacterium]|jgi:arsenite oxidase small subunit|nr:arsenate reductase (azurin) small subunit [Thermomicrobiales bacterium]
MIVEKPVDRRAFLKLSGLATGAVLSGGAVIVGSVGRRPVAAAAQAEKVVLAYPDYPNVAIAMLSDLNVGEPLFFDYPQAGQRNLLVKLGRAAEEGIGPDGDVVAFSAFCAHMGAPLDNVYDQEHAVLGPCPLHFSTFDLTKSGMLVMGKATQPLPQIVLAVDDAGQISATGMYGLIYGWPANLIELEGGN